MKAGVGGWVGGEGGVVVRRGRGGGERVSVYPSHKIASRAVQMTQDAEKVFDLN